MTIPLSEATAVIGGLAHDAVEAAAERFDEIARETAGRAVGGSMTLHGRGGRRTRVTLATKSTITDVGPDAVAVIRGTPGAMWSWLEKGTKPHEIGRRRPATAGHPDGEVVYLKGASYEHPIAGPILHLGATAKATWGETVANFHSEVPEVWIRVKGRAFGA